MSVFLPLLHSIEIEEKIQAELINNIKNLKQIKVFYSKKIADQFSHLDIIENIKDHLKNMEIL